MGNLDFRKRRNNVAYSWYSHSLILDECDLLKYQTAGGGVCSKEIIQKFANAFKNLDESIDELNCHAAHAQNFAQDTFCKKSIAFAERL